MTSAIPSSSTSPVGIQMTDLQRRLQTTLPDARLDISQLPGLEDISLALINADYQTGPLPGEVMHAVIANPAYWAFCWGSGLSLARWLIANPTQIASQRVLDLGPGSGVVAIAAAIAGAACVCACDNDPDAIAATEANAALNNVSIECSADLATLRPDFDLLMMADVLYDKANFGLIQIAKTISRRIIIADSRVSDVEDSDFHIIHHDTSLTLPNLGEFDEFKDVRFFEWRKTVD